MIKQVVAKLHHDVRNLNVDNLSGDDLGVVDDAVNLHYVDEFVDVELSEANVHLNDANVVEEM